MMNKTLKVTKFTSNNIWIFMTEQDSAIICIKQKFTIKIYADNHVIYIT